MVVAPYPWLENAAASLSAMVKELPNAVLLHGAPGTGGLELGLAFAKSLLCETPLMDGRPCGECAGCHLVAAGTHPDLKIVVSEQVAELYDLPYTFDEHESTDKKKRSRGLRIHQFRALSDFVVMTPHRGGRRIVFVYPADRILPEAAASLLKTLEEPSAGLHFILVADDIDGVLPTIRSRSRLLRLTRPTKEEALAWLKTQRVKDPEMALAMAGGSPLEAVSSKEGEQLSEKAQKALLHILVEGKKLETDEIIATYSVEMTTPAVAKYLSRFAYDLVRVKSGLRPYYFIKEDSAMADLVARVPLEKLLLWQEKVGQMRRSQEHPLSAVQVFEAIFISYSDCFR